MANTLRPLWYDPSEVVITESDMGKDMQLWQCVNPQCRGRIYRDGGYDKMWRIGMTSPGSCHLCGAILGRAYHDADGNTIARVIG